jgi:hypothetical protein
MSACTGPIIAQRTGFPLAPGYEGGPLADDEAQGVGIIGPTFDVRGTTDSLALRRGGARESVRGVYAGTGYVPAEEVLRFLMAHGITPPKQRTRKQAEVRVRLGWLQNSTAQIETDPPRLVFRGMPRRLWSRRLGALDVVDLRFVEPSGAGPVLIAEVWKAPSPNGRDAVPAFDASGHARLAFDAANGLPRALPHVPSPVTGEGKRGGALAPQPHSGHLRAPGYERDALGNLRCVEPSGLTLDLTALNGLQGFNARGPLQLSADRRILLAGDAIVWAETGTVLWRLDARADDVLALSPDGTLVAHASLRSPGRVSVWRLPAGD